MPNQNPIVLVHGALGFGPKELGPLSYWGTAFQVPSPLERYEASVGPLSSAHDRACELAAEIKGTQVDYGIDHAAEAGHERIGTNYAGKGFVPDWSASHPVHLVGHSLGSPTIRCLQHLLDIDYWGWGSTHRWVSSINTVSGVSNGSTLTYYFGADEQSGLLPAQSLADKLMYMIAVYMYATKAIEDRIYNFDLNQWGLVRQPGESLIDFMNRVACSKFLRGKDNACYSLTLQGAYADNARWETFPDTLYFSYITEQTFCGFNGRYFPKLGMQPGLIPLAAYIGQKEFARSPIPLSNFTDSEWWENDGMVSTYSQVYPRISGEHPVGDEFDDATPASDFQPGKWYYQWLHNVDHLEVCLAPALNQISGQKRFYENLFNRLANL